MNSRPLVITRPDGLGIRTIAKHGRNFKLVRRVSSSHGVPFRLYYLYAQDGQYIQGFSGYPEALRFIRETL